MAILIRRLLALCCAALLVTGCSVVDPLVIAEEYSVQDDGKAEIEVKIEGGAAVSRLKQRDVIHDLMLDLSRDPQRDSAAFDAMLELENLFELNGYPLVKVDYRIERDKGTKVVFTIKQFKQVLLESCRIVGGSIKEEELKKYLPQRSSDVIAGDDLYVAADMVTLRDGIVSHYRRAGFLDAKVAIEGPTPKLAPEIEKVAVTLRVDQGEQYRVGKVTLGERIEKAIAANTAHESDPGPAPPKSPLIAGQPFRAAQVQDYALALTAYFRRWGHPEPQILSSVVAHRKTHTVDVSFSGELGESVVVERIDVEGHGFVTEANIRERIEMKAGERFDGKQEEKSLMRLYRSGLFRTVETEYKPTGPGRIVLVFHVRETTRYLVQPLVGAGSYERIRGGLEFEMLSVFGTDFDFNSKGIISDKGHRVAMSIADSEFWPHLFGTDTTLSFSLDDFEREEPSYTDGATGFSPSLSKLFTREISGRIAYLIRDHGNTFSTVQDPGAQIGDYREGSLIVELSYDSRDNPIMPRRGSRFAVQHKWADDSLGGEVAFQRTRVSLSKVFELTERTRFVVRGEAGFLEPEDDMDSIPIQERFFNGGEITVRSFREDQLAPADLRDVSNQAIGGGYRNIFNAELRWTPPLRPLKAFDLELAIFGDAGNVGRRLADYGMDDMKYAVGAGIRILLPIGPVRFDYAHNPDREHGERDWTFHFSIGYPF